jgi:hypothetical protein
MKLKSAIVIFFAAIFSAGVFAEAPDECEKTCATDYADCKKVAENSTQKQACENDSKECNNACKK